MGSNYAKNLLIEYINNQTAQRRMTAERQLL